jgi:hypothetical protein
MNPSQTIQRVKLPLVHRLQRPLAHGRIQFRDVGFNPVLNADEVLLGPEQLVVVGYGQYAKSKYDLGVQDDVVIPHTSVRLTTEFRSDGENAISAVVSLPKQSVLRVVLRQFRDGKPVRSSAGAPPNGKSLGQILRIEASQNGQSIPVRINYDKAIWSGLSWAVGEITSADLKPEAPITVRCSSSEKQSVELRGELYQVSYAQRL